MRRDKRGGFKLIEVTVLCGGLCVLFAVALPNYIRLKGKAKEAVAKANLHDIQLELERYGVDHAKAYPAYLIGGSHDGPLDLASDPLLRAGYLSRYPANPFMRGKGGGADALAWQASLPSSTLYGADPLRPGSADGAAHGLRFGANGGLMGSVLADPRFREWAYRSGPGAATVAMPTFADVEYEFWDTADDSAGRSFLPGSFLYKAAGSTFPSVDQATLDTPFVPSKLDQYILAGYGGLRNDGRDVLGPERQGPSTTGLAMTVRPSSSNSGRGPAVRSATPARWKAVPMHWAAAVTAMKY